MKKTFLFFLILFLVSCGASVKSTFQNSLPSLTMEDKVAFLDVNHNVPENSKKIGNAKFGDTGFSTVCSFDSNLISARKLARQNGANIIKVTEKKSPNLWSSCYRLKIDFYYYEGNVSDLQQYQIQIK